MLKFLKAFGNGLIVVIIFALLALGIATIALQLPSVQTWAVRHVTADFRKARLPHHDRKSQYQMVRCGFTWKGFR
jgi:hypothetical protein